MTWSRVIQAESFELWSGCVARLVMQIENCMTKASKTAALRVRERRKPIRNQQTYYKIIWLVMKFRKCMTKIPKHTASKPRSNHT
jgi:hypothetical protein